MNKKWISVILSVMALLGIVLMTTNERREPQKEITSIQSEKLPSKEVTETHGKDSSDQKRESQSSNDSLATGTEASKGASSFGEEANASIRQFLDVFNDQNANEETRSKALGNLYAARTKMTDDELQSFWSSLLDVAGEKGLSAQFRSDELWVLNEIGMLLKHKEILGQDELDSQVAFLVDLSADEKEELLVRRMAITALGDLQVDAAIPVLAKLLSDETNWNTPELARSASIALSRLDSQQALDPVAQVLSNTTNSEIFGSAAYSMREMDDPAVLGVLNENRLRLGDNLSVDNAIAELFPMVTNVLANPSSSQITSAIEATQSIWQEEQRGIVNQQMIDIVQNQSASPEVRRQALGRLLEVSKVLHQEERQELLAQLDAIATEPLFSEERAQIQRERNVRVLSPLGGQQEVGNVQ